MKRTYVYLLSDETNPPELWEVIFRSEFGFITLKNCINHCVKVLVEESEEV